MEIDITKLAAELATLERKPRNLEPEVEARHFRDLMASKELAENFEKYDEPHVEGVGGSGLIVSARYAPHDSRRAIKVPRHHIYSYTPGKADPPPPPEDPEIDALSKVSHQNITRLFEKYDLPLKRGFCVVTELVNGHIPFDVYAKQTCGTPECRRDESKRERAFRELAQRIFEAADAVLHMHREHSLLHFDLKPDNIILSDSGHLYVTDLGFARDMKRYAAAPDVVIGFTYKYAHPDLHINKGAVVTSVPEKARKSIKGSDLSPRFDIFAFGRTLQELIKELEKIYGDSVYSSYTINYLHVVAALCLDGEQGKVAKTESFASDTPLDMPSAFFPAHKFTSFNEIKIALERLLGFRRVEDEIPELNPWSASTINSSDLGITTLSQRVRAVMDHPAIFRLTTERQLGMLDSVFPTATHTRFQHSLGVYHAVREYITALYYDPENPIFRVIFSEPACRRALLATLVHDAGHTTFGHDLEEINENEFSHTKIGESVLASDQPLDARNRTLRGIITGTDSDEWDIQLSEISLVLGGKISRPVDQVYIDILDGALDADKLDYLLRDSIESRVKYGQGIDHDRFLRSLTTIGGIDGGGKPVLRLAIKQKGAASAEAFAFARYQLYQSLYWHHTFRAVKGMLLTAASVATNEIKAQAKSQMILASDTPFRGAYIRELIGTSPPPVTIGAPTKGGKKTDRDVATIIDDLLRTSSEPNVVGPYTPDRTLRFLWKLSNGKPRRLIEDLMQRRYYKRVLEVSLADLQNQTWLRDQMKSERLEFQRKVDEALMKTLVRKIQDKSTERDSLVEDKALDVVERIAKERFVFVVDLPLRGWTSTGNAPAFVSDYKRRHFRVSVARHETVESENLWTRDLEKMMKRIAFFRVFCEPEIHNILTRVLDRNDIIASIGDVYTQFKLRVPPPPS